MVNLNTAFTSFANSDIGRDLKVAIPTAIALSVVGASPVAATAVGAALGAGSTSFFSDLGTELSSGVQAAASSVDDGLSNVEDAVSAVASPVVYSIGAFLNAVA